MKNLIITLATLFLFSSPTKAQFGFIQTKDHTLLVKGTAILKQMPEIISASISIKTVSKDYSDCQDKLLTKIERVKSTFIKQNIDAELIKIEEFTINEKVDYVEGRMVHNGFNGNISIIIESTYSPEFTKKLFTALQNDTSALNYQIGFKLSEEQKSKLRKQAISLAVDDAKEKATLIAKSSNVKLIKINSISYLDDELPWSNDRDIIKESIESSPSVFAAMVVSDSSTPSVDFNPKEIGIIKTVNIEWTIDEYPNKN